MMRLKLLSVGVFAVFAIVHQTAGPDLPLNRTAGATFDAVSWASVADAAGYRFTVDSKVSHTWDGARTTVKVQKGRPVVVETLLLGPTGTDPSVTPPPGTIEPPREPVTTTTNSSGLGVNVTTRQDLHDLVIDGTGDTGVLFQQNAGSSTLRRVSMTRIAALNAVSYGKHAVYGKAPDLTLEDVSASCSNYCASVFSLRFNGATLRRFHGDGASHIVTYYETSAVRGQVLVENGEGSFTGDTAVWMDAETDFQTAVYQSFTFRDVHFVGGSSSKFLKVSSGRMQGTVRIEGSTLNGRPVTASDVSGVPNLVIA